MLEEQVVALSEVVMRSKETGKHAEAERLARAQEESESKVRVYSTTRGFVKNIGMIRGKGISVPRTRMSQ